VVEWRVDSARLGARGPRGAWAAADVTLGVGGRAALVLGAGRRWHDGDVAAALAADDPTRARRGHFARLGVRLSPAVFARPALPPVVRPAATGFTVAAAGGGRYAVRARVPAARAVEVSGELTGWTPVPMRRVDADAWEAVLPAAAGTYRVSIRVDGGAWVAPPGLPAVDDDFGGTVGVLVVP
jgi:hypothetical protein